MKDAPPTCRLFLPGLGRSGPGRADLPTGEAHYALHVLRLRTGAPVELFDGAGARAFGRIVAAKRSATVEIERILPPAGRPVPRMHLAFAIPKGGRLDWLLEKVAELGAASLQPTIFERSIAGPASLSPAAMERWRGHCIAAARQSGADFLPEIRQPRPLANVLVEAAGMLGIVGDPAPQAQPVAEALRPRRAADVLILVGPEGGLTEAERAAALGAGLVPVRLGRTVLRIETAAVALLACAQQLAEMQMRGMQGIEDSE